MSRIQIRRWGKVFYATFRCVVRTCEMVWKSSYFPTRPDAQTYAAGAPRRGRRARCLNHRHPKGTPPCPR